MANKRISLTDAIVGLTLELKRYNDQNAPVKTTGKAADFFRASYIAGDDEHREMHDALKEIKAQDSDRRTHPRTQKRPTA